MRLKDHPHCRALIGVLKPHITCRRGAYKMQQLVNANSCLVRVGWGSSLASAYMNFMHAPRHVHGKLSV